MDPIAILVNCHAVYEKIQDKIDTVVSNRHQFELLKSKIGHLREPLAQLKKMHSNNQLPCSEGVLRDFYKLLTEIEEFVKQKRFQEQTKATSMALRWIAEAYNSAEDQAQFVEFDKMVSSNLQSLNLHITVQLLEFAGAAQRDTAKATAEVHSLQLTMIDMKKLVWDVTKAKNKLGEGTFSTVTIGQYNKEYVAIKQVRQMDIKSIQKEAKIMQYANHRNILSMKGVEMSKGIIVMELAVCSLSDYLYRADPVADERARPLVAAAAVPTQQWRLDVIRDVSDAVRYLHAHNILHRDIKSPNVLLFRDPVTGHTTAKVGDFGLALAVEIASRGFGSVLATGAPPTGLRAVGTYSYMAPELFDREPGQRIAYSEASDVYSLGVLANEIMSGATPWDASARDADIPNWVLNKRLRPRLWTSTVEAGNELEQRAKGLLVLIGHSDHLQCCWSHLPHQRCTADDVYIAAAGLQKVAEGAAQGLTQGSSVGEMSTRSQSSDGGGVPVSPVNLPSTALSTGAPPTANVSVVPKPQRNPPTRPSGFLPFFRAREVAPIEEDAEDAEKLEEFALQMRRAFPEMQSKLVRVYAKTLFAVEIYTTARLSQQRQEKDGPAYDEWASGLGIERWDAQDIRDWEVKDPSLACATLVELDALHGADRLVEWLAQYVPDLPVAAKRRQIAEALCAANVTCCARLERRVQDVEWLVKLGVDRLDAEDIVSATAMARNGGGLGKFSLQPLSVVPIRDLHRDTVIEQFALSLRCAVPDMSVGHAMMYCTGLYAKGIYTVARLLRVVRRADGKPYLKQLQWHDYDIQDLLEVIRTNRTPAASLPSVEALHGAEVLSLWMLDHVPNIALPRIRTAYCKALVEHNISTVHRLVLRGCDKGWLVSIGISQLDAKDIVTALVPLNALDPAAVHSKQEAEKKAAEEAAELQRLLDARAAEKAAREVEAARVTQVAKDAKEAAVQEQEEKKAKLAAEREAKLAPLREKRPASKWKEGEKLTSEYLCCKPYCEFLLEPEQVDGLFCSRHAPHDCGERCFLMAGYPGLYPVYGGLACCRLAGFQLDRDCDIIKCEWGGNDCSPPAAACLACILPIYPLIFALGIAACCSSIYALRN